MAPNVFDCVEVSLQPRFSGVRDVRQRRAVRGTGMSHGVAERCAKEFAALLAPSTMKTLSIRALPDVRRHVLQSLPLRGDFSPRSSGRPRPSRSPVVSASRRPWPLE